MRIILSKKLRKLLEDLEGRKIVLTNNPSDYTSLILDSRGVRSLFSCIYGIRELEYVQKPDARSFSVLNKLTKDKKSVVFIDDEKENIITAGKLGYRTVLIGKKYSQKDTPDIWLPFLA